MITLIDVSPCWAHMDIASIKTGVQMNMPTVTVRITNVRKNCPKRHRKPCKNGPECRFNIKNTCEFKHGLESQKRNIEKIQVEASQMEQNINS